MFNSQQKLSQDQSVNDDQDTQVKEPTLIDFQTDQFHVTSQKSLRREKYEIYSNFQSKDNSYHNIYFGQQSQAQPTKDKKKMAGSNKVRTQKYTAWSWAPKSLYNQFRRVSNVYFLMISIFTFLPFSPKDPTSMIGTFVFVLLFTMLKEAYEDYKRYQQDKEINNKTALVLNTTTFRFEDQKWENIEPGNIIKIKKEESIPADILMLYSSHPSGIVYVDTINLDGETNLKDKTAMLENFDDKKLVLLNGMIKCELPNENLEKWDGLVMFTNQGLKPIQSDIRNLALRGSQLRNTHFAIGVVVYTGMNTKIMKNHKKSKQKISNIMKMMNNMLYTVFIFQLLIVIIMASLNVDWVQKNTKHLGYLNISFGEEGRRYFIQLLVFWTAYSHMIPISLYVIIELLKLGIAQFINKDIEMYDSEQKRFAQCRNSDLVEELGQIELIFSDKTGTLTQNKMIFRKCQINGIRYGEPTKAEDETEDGMCISGIKRTVKAVRQELSFGNLDSDDEYYYPYATQFFLNLVLCNTVSIERVKETKELSYKATSPDEMALVKGAKMSGFQLLSRERKEASIYNMIKKKKENYKIKAVFPFDSDRKRMSVLIKDPNDEYILYTKGADTVMMERINFEKSGVEGIKELIDEDLRFYSSQGLRTLVVANRIIQEEEYLQFKKIKTNLIKAKASVRDEKLNVLYGLMEQRMRYLGSVAIEDKLQEGVPVTISQLLRANIRFFMLTGDKLETAIEIGKSCKIIQENMTQFILNEPQLATVQKKLQKMAELMEINTEEQISTLIGISQHKQSIIVEGPTLATIIGDEKLSDLFFHICIRSKSVICCRMSPKQKADVVQIFKSRGKWITLAIGDGANDVSMLNEAHIGVGITGEEGTQAARAGDFSVSQFKSLMKLVLFHGRLSYLRVSTMICYYFYKNIILVFTELYFPFYNGFSGQIYFLDWLPMMYNAIFTSWYCLFSQLLERDVNDQFTYKYPIVYKAGQLGKYFNYQVFWKWIIFALIHGILCFYIPTYACVGEQSDQIDNITGDHWTRSTISFSIIIHLVFYKLVLETRHLNLIAFTFGVISLLLYYTFLGIGQIPQISYITQIEGLGVLISLFKNPNFWIMVGLMPFACLIPDITLHFIQQVYFPTPVDSILSKQKFDPHFDFRLHWNLHQSHMDMKLRQSSIKFEKRRNDVESRRQTFFLNKSLKIDNQDVDTKDMNIIEIINLKYQIEQQQKNNISSDKIKEILDTSSEGSHTSDRNSSRDKKREKQTKHSNTGKSSKSTKQGKQSSLRSLQRQKPTDSQNSSITGNSRSKDEGKLKSSDSEEEKSERSMKFQEDESNESNSKSRNENDDSQSSRSSSSSSKSSQQSQSDHQQKRKEIKIKQKVNSKEQKRRVRESRSEEDDGSQTSSSEDNAKHNHHSESDDDSESDRSNSESSHDNDSNSSRSSRSSKSSQSSQEEQKRKVKKGKQTKKNQQSFSESSRSLNMSLRSNQGLMVRGGRDEIKRKSKNRKTHQQESSTATYENKNNNKNHDRERKQQASSSEYQDQKDKDHDSLSHQSLSLVSDFKSQQPPLNQHLKVQVYNGDTFKGDNNTSSFKKNKSLELRSKKFSGEKNIKENKSADNQGPEANLKMSEINSRSNIVQSIQDDEEIKTKPVVQVKPKVPKINFAMSILNIFKSNKAKILDATQSTFDQSKYRNEKSRAPATYVVDQLMHSMRTQDKSSAHIGLGRAQPAVIETLGHPLESHRSHKKAYDFLDEENTPNQNQSNQWNQIFQAPQITGSKTPRRIKKYVEKYKKDFC